MRLIFIADLQAEFQKNKKASITNTFPRETKTSQSNYTRCALTLSSANPSFSNIPMQERNLTPNI